MIGMPENAVVQEGQPLPLCNPGGEFSHQALAHLFELFNRTRLRPVRVPTDVDYKGRTNARAQLRT
jgi:hypothetical protein